MGMREALHLIGCCCRRGILERIRNCACLRLYLSKYDSQKTNLLANQGPRASRTTQSACIKEFRCCNPIPKPPHFLFQDYGLGKLLASQGLPHCRVRAGCTHVLCASARSQRLFAARFSWHNESYSMGGCRGQYFWLALLWAHYKRCVCLGGQSSGPFHQHLVVLRSSEASVLSPTKKYDCVRYLTDSTRRRQQYFQHKHERL